MPEQGAAQGETVARARHTEPWEGGSVTNTQDTALTSGTALCPASRVCYVPHRGQLEMFVLRDTPSPLGAKLAVLRLFTCSMQRRLREVRAEGWWGLEGGSGP